jgi:NADH dehydrogenase
MTSDATDDVAATSLHHVVIVGAGFAGLSAARNLANAPVQVTLIDKRNYHAFQPLLYQVATAALSPAQIAQPIRAIVRKQKNCTVALGEVTAIDPATRTVYGHKGAVKYDTLILATGATHNYFGNEAWAGAAPGLKSIEDATNLRQRILSAFEQAETSDNAEEQRALMTFTVIGAGPTGVEMAGAIAELARHTLRDDFRRINPANARIILVEAGTRVLSAFPDALSHRAQKDLERLGVEVRLGTPVTDCSRIHVKIGDETIPCRTIIWGAGVQASPAGKWLNTECDRAGRVLVQPDLTVANHPEIFVLGDTASLTDAKGVAVPGLAPAAVQQGSYAARVILARLNNQPAPAAFAYRNYGTMATIGRGKAIADFKHFSFSGFLAWALWGGVHIMPLVGFRNRLVVALDWLWSYLTHARGVRLITSSGRRDDDI